jgi:hypothetical protein
VAVLIGLAGPAECVLHAVPLLALLGPQLGRVGLAVAIDFDSAESDEWNDAKAQAAVELEVADALLSSRHDSTLVLVGGAPTDAFLRHARSAGYDMLVLAGEPPAETTAPRYGDGAAVVVHVPRGSGDATADTEHAEEP